MNEINKMETIFILVFFEHFDYLALSNVQKWTFQTPPKTSYILPNLRVIFTLCSLLLC